ncbi:MAG: permease [Zoogloeaceae bacterium]|nr:hypothetical protein [Rhodocyclaceae bacterium]MCP5235899.1 permease [Zoogloeaceae bacterium]
MSADRRHAVAMLAMLGGLGACSLERSTIRGPDGLPAAAPAVIVEQASPLVAGDVNLRAILAFYRNSRGMSAAELAREREALKGRVSDPLDALRLAILLGHRRSDLVRALGLLDDIAESDSPQAVALQPLARLLSDQYAERLKLDTQADRLGVTARDAELRASEASAEVEALRAKASALQEKIDALAEIERSLPGRPAPPVPMGGATQ